MRFHIPNVVICKIVSSTQKTPLLKAYLPPSTIDHLPYLEKALNRVLGRDHIVMGDLNADIRCLQNPQNQQVADSLESFGLVRLLGHFIKWLRFQHIRTWWQVRQEKILRSRSDYILGSDRCMFDTVVIRDLRNFASDHFSLRACLLRQPTRFRWWVPDMAPFLSPEHIPNRTTEPH